MNWHIEDIIAVHIILIKDKEKIHKENPPYEDWWLYSEK
jgi:hypothetical protein